jgi:hypothetical protein
MGWVGHVARREDNYIHFIGEPQGKLQRECLEIHGWVASCLDLKTKGLERLIIDWLMSVYEGVAGSCNSSNEPTGSMKWETFRSSRGILLHAVSRLLIYQCKFYKLSYISVHFLLIRSKWRISQLMYISSTNMMLANHACTYQSKRNKYTRKLSLSMS